MKDAINISRKPAGMFPLELSSAARGDVIVYHIGPHCGGPHKLDAAAASDAKMCIFFCKRVREELFAYCAMKR